MTELEQSYAVTFVVIKAELAKIYENNWSFNEFLKYSRAKNMDKRLEEIITRLYKDNQAGIKEMLKVNYIKSIDKTKDQFDRIYPIKKQFDVVKAINEPVSGVDWFTRLGKNRGDVLYNLSSTIKSGIANGLPYSDVTKNLQKVFGKDLVKNDTIARTETRRVTMLGQTDVCDELAKKVPLQKTWKTMEDERVRAGKRSKKGRRGPNHMAMNNVTIPYDENFITPTGSTGKAPTQLAGTYAAADNINCRCIMTVKLADKERLTVKGRGIIKINDDSVKTYDLNFYPDDDDLPKAVLETAATEKDKYFQVLGLHSDGVSFQKEGSRSKITPQELALKMKKSDGFGQKDVKIYSCGIAGEGATAAQEIADLLGVNVKAPTGRLVLFENEEAGYYFDVFDKNGNRSGGDKGWILVKPKNKKTGKI